MRPNKQINSGAHRSGPVVRGKGRFYITGLSTADDVPIEDPLQPTTQEEVEPALDMIPKYTGRASVGPYGHEGPDRADNAAGRENWIDPLDIEDQVDFTQIVIDLRENMRDEPPETYYQRHGSRVPGRE